MRFTAPASSANLGPGYDVLAVAIDLHNELQLSPGAGAMSVVGEGAGKLPTGADNLVARCFADAAGPEAKKWDLHCTNRVPLARGLGSSTAAAALGLMAGWTVGGSAWTADELFAELTELDGHPDNAAACAYGGLVAVTPRFELLSGTALSPAVDVLAIAIPRQLAFIFVVPGYELSTAAARDVVPQHPSAESVAAASAALMAHLSALKRGDLAQLRATLHSDVMHEPYRAALVPDLARVRETIATTAALGATLSGAGPTVLVWCEAEHADDVTATLRTTHEDCRVMRCAPVATGAGFTPPSAV